MHMAARTRRWTRIDLARLPDDGRRYEVVDGALYVTPPPSPGHEMLHHFIARILQPWLDRERLGDAFHGKAAVVLGESQVEPDLIVSPRVRPAPKSWADMPRPILVVEILSPATARRDQVAKRDLYMRHGIPEYWIVNPETRSIRVVRPGVDDRVESARLEWAPSRASGTLAIDVESLFREALG